MKLSGAKPDPSLQESVVTLTPASTWGGPVTGGEMKLSGANPDLSL
jgi:hypothetical protein